MTEVKQKVASFNPKTYNSTASNLILAYADQGIGKTCLTLTAPEGWKIYVADIDGGFESAATLWSGDPSLLTVRTAESFRDFHAAVWNMPPHYNLYILDTYTMAMNRIKKHVERQMNVQPEDLVDWWKIGGKISAMAMSYFDQYCELVKQNNAWGLVLCQEKTEGEDTPKVVPDLVGQCRRHVAGVCNEVLHLEKRVTIVGGKRTLTRQFRTLDDPGVMAKDRSNALEPFEPANLAYIINKIKTKRGINGGEEQRQTETKT